MAWGDAARPTKPSSPRSTTALESRPGQGQWESQKSFRAPRTVFFLVYTTFFIQFSPEPWGAARPAKSVRGLPSDKIAFAGHLRRHSHKQIEAFHFAGIWGPSPRPHNISIVSCQKLWQCYQNRWFRYEIHDSMVRMKDFCFKRTTQAYSGMAKPCFYSLHTPFSHSFVENVVLVLTWCKLNKN